MRWILPLCLVSAALSPQARPAPHSGQEQSSLRVTMESMKTHLKGLAMALQREDGRDAALGEVAELQRLVLAAKLETPPGLDGMPQGERAAHALAFRRELAAVLRELAELEIDLLEGRREAAQTRVRKSLFELRERAHERFQRGD
jgi:hypothetical protein